MIEMIKKLILGFAKYIFVEIRILYNKVLLPDQAKPLTSNLHQNSITLTHFIAMVYVVFL